MGWPAWATMALTTSASTGAKMYQNQKQIGLAKDQMDFQERMSNTAHRRQMTDLKKAGINPILTAKYGGASSPMGAMASLVDPVTPALQTGLSAVDTVMGAKSTAAGIDKTKADTQMVNNLMSSSEVVKDIGDYMQRYTSNLERVSQTIEEGIGKYVQWNYEAGQIFRRQVEKMGEYLRESQMSIEQKIDEFKKGATEIYINITEDLGLTPINKGIYGDTP